MELTNATKVRGRELGWDDALIARIEQSPVTEGTVANLAAMHIPGERVAGFLDLAERLPDQFGAKNFFNFIRTSSERGLRATPGPDGLELANINIGTYGQVPDRWPYENDAPRGSHPNRNSYSPGSYYIYDKSEVWAEGLDVLYEDAIRDRWIPATDLDWRQDLSDLPEELERSYCQFATVMSSHALAEQKIIAKWLEPISYGFHEVMLFLGTQIYDAGHKVEAFRKRALANGGGLGQAPLGTLYRGWYGALKFTAMLTYVNVIYKSYELSLFESAAGYAQTNLDRRMLELMAQDSRRHLEYGKRHLLWYLQHHDRAEQTVQHWLGKGETTLSNELRHSPVERESLIVLLAGGLEKLDIGVERLRTIRQKQLMDYIHVLDEIGIDRLPMVDSGLVRIAGEPTAI